MSSSIVYGNEKGSKSIRNFGEICLIKQPSYCAPFFATLLLSFKKHNLQKGYLYFKWFLFYMLVLLDIFRLLKGFLSEIGTSKKKKQKTAGSFRKCLGICPKCFQFPKADSHLTESDSRIVSFLQTKIKVKS